MKIFIGSASETIEDMELVSSWIEEMGHSTVPWNTPEVFPAGGFTWASLVKTAKNADAAVFIFSEDDRTSKDYNTVWQPRGNVLIEFGLFTGKLGEERTIFCRKGNPKTISDLHGLTYIDINEGHHSQARVRLREWLKGLTLKFPVPGPKDEDTAHPIKWIHVTGSGDKENPPEEGVLETSRALGRALAKARFGLITGAWPHVDEEVTKAFHAEARKRKLPLKNFIKQVILVDRDYETFPDYFKAGELILSQTPYSQWADITRASDACVLVAGDDGALQTSLWMNRADKPVFALARTGGDAEKYFFTAKEFGYHECIPGITGNDYERLGNFPPEVIEDLIDLLNKWAKWPNATS